MPKGRICLYQMKDQSTHLQPFGESPCQRKLGTARIPLRGLFIAMNPRRKLDPKYSDPRWQKKRLERFEAAGWKCQCCDSESKTLHLHHAYYMPNRDLWDYPDWSLTCLCHECHEIKHTLAPDEERGPEQWEIMLEELMSNPEPDHCYDASVEIASHLHQLKWSYSQRHSRLEKYLYMEVFCKNNNLPPIHELISSSLFNSFISNYVGGLEIAQEGDQKTPHANFNQNAVEILISDDGGAGNSVY